MDFLVLGPVEVRNQGVPVSIGGPKQRSILALLVAEVGHPVSVDRIIDDVYGDDAPEGARRSVQTLVSMIRRELGDIVKQAGGGYVLGVDADAIDAVRFEHDVRLAIPMVDTDPEVAADALRDALAQWRGHPYSDIDSRSILEPEITRLRELRLAALESRIDADLALGRHRELTGELEALAVEHPLREGFRAQHMLALYRCGRQTEALRAFDRTRTFLGDEIGVSPSPELCELEQRILEQDPGLDLPASPSVTQRAVLVVDVADMDASRRVGSHNLELLTETLALIDDAMTRHNVDSSTQRGSAVYASFTTVDDAVAAIEDVMSTATVGPIVPRASIDYGDIELHDSGAIGGPPVRRSAGMVALANPGQVILSAEANHAAMGGGKSGLVVRSLGTYRIHGVESNQQVFQLVLPGHEGEFPPLRLDANPPPVPTDRRAIPGYELREPIVSDLAGTTYRAYQPSVGREVEVTVIDPAWASELGFVSRFEVETQLVSRLQHPHVIPLLDHWRDPSGAYLVSMAVGVGTLAERLAGGGFDVEQGRRLITQVGDALSQAHEVGIVHGALSPHSIVIDDSGNGYLSATGFLMRLAGVAQASSIFIAPELAQGGAATPASDVYGMGRLADKLLGGSPMHGGPGDASRLRTVIQRATAQEAADRYPSMGQFLAALGEGPGRGEHSPGPTSLRNPYKGLAAFREPDVADFFGRSQSLTELIRMLGEHDLVAVVGPSGSGKSSLVHAGLMPAVRSGALGSSSQWVVADLFPGSYPLEELESALSRVAVEDPGALIDELGSDDRGLARVIKRVLPADTSLLLVIDQFEELFTLTRDDETRDRLLAALLSLAMDERSDTKVVLTLRADYVDRPLQYHEFGEELKAGTFLLTVPGPDQLIEAIKRPADVVGASWEPGLPEQILDDVAQSPGLLPLLQYSLTELFDARHSDQLTFDAYRGNGGVIGALASRAEAVFAQLEPTQQSLARQLFLRLVTVQSAGKGTRRRTRLVELNALDDPREVSEVLDAFGVARLLVFDRDPISRSPTVEVAHEALLTHWPRLDGWIDEAGEDLLLHGRLWDAVGEWVGRDRDDDYLLSGGRLAQFDNWALSTDLTLASAENEFLDASRAETDRQRSRRRRRRNLITAGFGVAAVVAGFFAVSATRNAEIAHSRESAASAINVLDEDPELSVLLALQAAGIAEPPFESVSALHESLAAHHKIFTYQWPTEQDAVDLSTRLSPDGTLIAANAGGNYMEVVEVDGGERLWDREFAEGAILRLAFAPDGSSLLVTVGWASSGGSAPNSALEEQLGVHRLNARTGEIISHLPIHGCGLVTIPPALSAVGPGAGTHLIAEIPQDPECSYRSSRGEASNWQAISLPPMSLLDLESGDIEILSDGTEKKGGVLATPDGSRLLFQGDDIDDREASEVINREGGGRVAIVPGYPAGISADGNLLLTVMAAEDQLATWDVSNGQPEAPLTTIAGFGGTSPRDLSAWLAPDGSSVAREVGSSLELIDSRSGDIEMVLQSGLGSNERLSFSADGSRLLMGEVFGGAAVVFDRTFPSELGGVKLCDQMYAQSGYLDVRGDVASVLGSCDVNNATLADVYLIDPVTLEVSAVLADQGWMRTGLSADGSLLATQVGRSAETQDGEVYLVSDVVLRDTTSGRVSRVMEGLCEWDPKRPEPGAECAESPNIPFPDWPWELTFSPDDALLAMASLNDSVILWNTGTGEIVRTSTVHHDSSGPNEAMAAAFSPSGDHIAVSFGPAPKELWLVSAEDGQSIAQYVAPDEADTIEPPSQNFLFTPDGETLIGSDLSSFGEGRIVFMDGRTLEHLDQISDAHANGVADLALNPDGSLLASAGVDGVVRIWEMATRSLVHEVPVSTVGEGVGGVDFVGDTGHLLVTALESGELRKVTTDTEELLDIARARVTRGFSETECSTYRIDPCPTLEEIRNG